MMTTPSIPPMALAPTDRIRIDERPLKLVSANHRGIVVVGEDNLNQSFTHQALHDLLSADRLEIDQGFFSLSTARLRLDQGNIQLTDLDDEERGWVKYRHELVKRFLRYEAAGEFSRSDASLRRAALRIHAELTAEGLNGKAKRLCRQSSKKSSGKKQADEATHHHAPSPFQLRNWLLRFEQHDCSEEALIPRYRRSGNTDPKLPEAVRVLLAKQAEGYCDKRKLTGKNIWEKVKEEIDALNAIRANAKLDALPVPSLKAVYRAIQKLDSFRVMAGRQGAEVARRKFAIVHEGIRAERLLERVEMDEWKVTIMALAVDIETWKSMAPAERKKVPRVRCHITAAIDCASRCVMALHLHEHAPSRASSIAALQMITQDKTPLSDATGLSTAWFMRGRPELLVTDGGSAFKDHIFRRTVADLRVDHLYARKGFPEDRGTIERLFDTLEHYLCAEFSGRTFRSVGERGEYESELEASLTVDQLRLVLPMLVARYHETGHEGLGGETPLNAWNRLAGECSVRPAPSPSQARAIFGLRTARRISGRGVRFLGLHYQSREVQELRRKFNQRPVAIRVDPLNIGEISVSTDAGWVAVKCVEDFAKGLSAADWIAANARLRQRFAAEAAIARPALLEAIAAIREVARSAHETAGLKPNVISDAEFNAAENGLLRTFRIREQAAPASDENDDILGVAEADAFTSDGDDHLEESDADHDDIVDAGDMKLEDN